MWPTLRYNIEGLNKIKKEISNATKEVKIKIRVIARNQSCSDDAHHTGYAPT